MDYRQHLYQPLSKRFVDLLALEIFAHPTDFQLVFNLIFDSEFKVAWRAAWACQKISEKHPEWFTESHFHQLSDIILTTRHSGLQRGCLSILNNIAIPQPVSVPLINACFDWMISSKSAIAVQALSMKLLYRICKFEPDLKTEFVAYLENVNYEDYTPGFRSTRNNVLKALKYS